MINAEKGNLVSESVALFMQAAILSQKYADSVFYKNAGISWIKFIVLQILATADKPVIPSELARKTLKVRHDITTLIQRMKRDGLVDVSQNITDRRSVVITLTEKGREKLNQAVPIAEEIANQVMLKISKTNMASLSKSLNTLKENAVEGDKKLSETPR